MSKIFAGTPHYYIDIPFVLRQDKPKCRFGFKRWENGFWCFLLLWMVTPRIYLSL